MRTLDRFYDMLSTLEFYIKQHDENTLNVENCKLSEASRGKLAKLTLDRLKKDPTYFHVYINHIYQVTKFRKQPMNFAINTTEKVNFEVL